MGTSSLINMSARTGPRKIKVLAHGLAGEILGKFVILVENPRSCNGGELKRRIEKRLNAKYGSGAPQSAHMALGLWLWCRHLFLF